MFAYNPQMRTSNSSVYTNTPSATTQAYPPSVPLSVYRDLAAELQAAQANIDALSNQNHQLAQENQLLRQEIAKTVQSVLHLQHLLNSPQEASYPQVPRPVNNVKNNTKRPVNKKQKHPRQQVPRPRPPVVYTEMEIPASMPDPIFIEEREVIAYPHSEADSGEIKGWWLLLAVIFIIILGFGAGYLVVRPFFERQSR